MNVIYKINWVLLILLSISTGIFKILQQEADIQLFEAIGMSVWMTTVLGVVQLVGGVLLIPSKTRRTGAMIMMPTFVLASAAVFVNQLLIFGFVSLVFILMAYWVFKRESLSESN